MVTLRSSFLRVRLVAIVAALAAGCGKTVQSSDAAGDRPSAKCAGTIDVSGTTPQGPFTATSVYTQVAIMSPSCTRGLDFIVGDATTGAAFEFLLQVDTADGGAPVPLGKTSAIVDFAGRTNTDAGLFQTMTGATIDVTSADSPPFATCEAAWGDPIESRDRQHRAHDYDDAGWFRAVRHAVDAVLCLQRLPGHHLIRASSALGDAPAAPPTASRMPVFTAFTATRCRPRRGSCRCGSAPHRGRLRGSRRPSRSAPAARSRSLPGGCRRG